MILRKALLHFQIISLETNKDYIENLNDGFVQVVSDYTYIA